MMKLVVVGVIAMVAVAMASPVPLENSEGIEVNRDRVARAAASWGHGGGHWGHTHNWGHGGGHWGHLHNWGHGHNWEHRPQHHWGWQWGHGSRGRR